eukprot:1143131-Pelagomonas_calceolata.AAC.1
MVYRLEVDPHEQRCMRVACHPRGMSWHSRGMSSQAKMHTRGMFSMHRHSRGMSLMSKDARAWHVTQGGSAAWMFERSKYSRESAGAQEQNGRSSRGKCEPYSQQFA